MPPVFPKIPPLAPTAKLGSDDSLCSIGVNGEETAPCHVKLMGRYTEGIDKVRILSHPSALTNDITEVQQAKTAFSEAVTECS